MVYSWKVIKLVTQDVVNADGATLTDAVTRVQWIRTGTTDDGTKAADVVGWFEPSANNVAASDFVAYADLTENTVIGWLEAGLDSSLLTSYNNRIQEKIDTIGTEEKALPW